MIQTTPHRDVFTPVGKGAFVVSLFFVFSISAEYRLGFAGFLVHPYLIVLPAMLLFTGFRMRLIPQYVILPLILFFIFFSLGSLQNVNPLSEIVKVGAGLFTLIYFGQAIQSGKDFRIICWGFLAVAVVIGVMGFFTGEDEGTVSRLSGINVLEGIGNKNAQSLFTLPGLFFSIFLTLHYLKHKRQVLVLILLCCIFFITIQIFLSANRSGWLGLFVIFVSYMLFSRINVRALLIGGVLIAFAYIAIENYASDIVEHKRDQTLEGYSSDVGRQMLIRESMLIGLENPVFGIGFDNLTRELARRFKLNRNGIDRIDTHFMFGYIFGATGIFALFFFVLFLVRLVRRKVYLNKAPLALRQAWLLLACFVSLFVIRSFFTREILYSPTFMGGIGLIFGYYLMLTRQVINVNRNTGFKRG